MTGENSTESTESTRSTVLEDNTSNNNNNNSEHTTTVAESVIATGSNNESVTTSAAQDNVTKIPTESTVETSHELSSATTTETTDVNNNSTKVQNNTSIMESITSTTSLDNNIPSPTQPNATNKSEAEKEKTVKEEEQEEGEISTENQLDTEASFSKEKPSLSSTEVIVEEKKEEEKPTPYESKTIDNDNDYNNNNNKDMDVDQKEENMANNSQSEKTNINEVMDQQRESSSSSMQEVQSQQLQQIEESSVRSPSSIKKEIGSTYNNTSADYSLSSSPPPTSLPPVNDIPTNPIKIENESSSSPNNVVIKNSTEPTNTKSSSSSSSHSNNSSSSNAQNGFRPLNVKDALTYLDQVKVQFSDHPEVYNKFLDIMKDFKSQAIDTPGVIERVSTLFRGHPLLISGFNTFLPPGYCIECITDELQHDIIRVTTPNGTTTTNAGEPLRLGSNTTGAPTHEQLYYSGGVINSGYSGYGIGMNAATTTGRSTMSSSTSSSSSAMYGNGHSSSISMNHLQHQQQHPGHHPSSTTTGTMSHHPHSHLPAQQLHHSTDDSIGNRRTPVEFNHAINYVNKIKNRFASDPDIYKQFLEILQTYQKEQRPIQEVYGQVQVLFNGDNELLAEFKQFLPDTTGIGSSSVYTSTPNGRKNLMMVPGLSNVTTGRKKRGATMITSGMSKRSKLQNKMDTQTSEVRSIMALDEEEVVRPFVSGEEVEFFERVKKYIGSKATYNAFLKVLNLFSQQIVDQNVLVNRVEGFIGGNKELFDMFKTLVGYDGKDELIENVPADDSNKPDLSQSESYGPSYRIIPKAWQESQVCSGKDELCLEVLNDKYMSHPTWASEDSGYVASKKNQYEEALHRVEEERYDYDLNIEANLNTIALLEPIMKKISTMTPEEKIEYTLPIGLGGPSKTIYQRIIKKIYGNEKGLEIINLLHTNPAQSVPIVLKRLKQKDDEWKRAQREWNKIWREVEAKNYFKALDYQGITFKTKDKRRIMTKNLLLEIEELFIKQQEDYQQKQQDYNISSTANLLVPARKPAQFTFYFKDVSIFKDITKIICFAFEHTDIYTTDNRDRAKEFMESLLPLIFNISTVIPDDTDSNNNNNNNNNNRMATPTEDGDDVATPTGGEEDGNDDDTADDEAADEADDEEDEESRSIQSYDSDGDAVMNGPASDASSQGGGKNNRGGGGARDSNRRKTMRTRRRRPQANNDDGLLKEILTRNMPSTTTATTMAATSATSPSTSIASTPNEDDGNNGADTAGQSDADSNHSITKQNDTDVDVPDTFNDTNNNNLSKQNTPNNEDDSINNNSNNDDDAVTPVLPPSSPFTTTKNNQINNSNNSNNKRQVYNFFANSEYYCFFRLYQMIYDRLYQMKQLDEDYRKNPTKTKNETKAVLNLNAKSRRVSGYYLDLSRGYYNALIKLIDKFFEGQVDQQTFEDVSRYIFGRKAYVLFTIDKVVMALLRHVNLIVLDGKSSLLMDLFKQDYELENVDAQILGEYRLRVEEIMGKDEVLFNLSYDTIRQALSIQILGNNDDHDKSKQDGYDEYVSNYIDWVNATTGVNPSDLTPRFLKRNMKKCTDEEARRNIIVRSGMQYKICRDTYHMFYIIGTEDVYMRLPPTETTYSSSPSDSKWKTWLESDKGWSKGLTDKNQTENDARKLLFSDKSVA